MPDQVRHDSEGEIRMKILVTGATGFVGTQLIQKMAREGHAIRALVRKPEQAGELKKLNVEICQGDVTDRASLADALREVDTVIHMASRVGETGTREEFFSVNLQGTLNLLEACRHVPLKRFIHVSSLSVITGYMDHDGSAENSPYRYTGEHYADSKIEAEKAVMEYNKKYQIPAVILRPGFIYGPGDRLFLPAVIQNLREKKVIFIDGGKKLLNLTYVGNLIEAILLAMKNEKAVGEIFNITDGEEISKQEFFFAIADAMQLPRPVKSIPFGVAWMLCSVLTLIHKIFGIKRPPRLSRIKLRFLGQNQFFSINKAENRLGYQHTVCFKEGLKEALAWQRANAK